MRVGMSLQLQLVMIPLVENVRVIRRGRKLQSPWWRCSIVGYVIALVTYPIMSLLYPQYIYIFTFYLFIYNHIYIHCPYTCLYAYIVDYISLLYPYFVPSILYLTNSWHGAAAGASHLAFPGSCHYWIDEMLEHPKAHYMLICFDMIFFCFVLTHKTISWTNRLGSLRLFMFFLWWLSWGNSQD